MKKTAIVLVIILTAAAAYYLTRPQAPEFVDNAYRHDKFQTRPIDLPRDFAAFTVSFDSADDDDGDGVGEARGVPEWVAYDVKRFDGPCVPTTERPKWFSDEELVRQGVAPRDNSYSMAPGEREKNGYDRGHMAPKFLAARLGEEAERNTHTLLNAVPQRHEFNAGIWLDLEKLTGAWAQRYGEVWVVTGPIFRKKKATRFLGDRKKKEFPVAIPDELFKIVIRETKDPNRPEVLAFVYPQESPSYARRPFDQAAYLRSVDEIENATGVDFLTALPDDVEGQVEAARATSLWPVSDGDFLKECRQ
jgi:endonuclease G